MKTRFIDTITLSSPAHINFPSPSQVRQVTGAPIWLLPFNGKIPVEVFRI